MLAYSLNILASVTFDRLSFFLILPSIILLYCVTKKNSETFQFLIVSNKKILLNLLKKNAKIPYNKYNCCNNFYISNSFDTYTKIQTYLIFLIFFQNNFDFIFIMKPQTYL